MNMEVYIWTTLPHALVGLVIGWVAVLLGRNRVRLLQGCTIGAACIIPCLLTGAAFAGPWWVAPAGLLLGAAAHATFLLFIQSNTSKP